MINHVITMPDDCSPRGHPFIYVTKLGMDIKLNVTDEFFIATFVPPPFMNFIMEATQTSEFKVLCCCLILFSAGS